MGRRLFFLNFIFVFISATVVLWLFTLQVLSHDFYKALAENQHQLYKTLIPVRGEIYVRDGKGKKFVPVVTNIEKKLVYAVPSEITDKQKAATELSKLIGLPQNEILQKISDNERKWIAIKKELPESESVAIKASKISGIYLQPETYRLYSERELASQVLGFVAFKDDQRVGQYGIEEGFQDILAGHAGSLTLEKDVSGRWISGGVRKLDPAVDGADIVLTLDRAVQFKAEQVLKATIEKYEAEGGSIVIVSPKDGRILTMASYPTFDPNIFNKVENPAVYRNQVVSESYEPGSVFKPITAAAALDADVITPDLIFEDSGSIALDEFVIKNANEQIFGKQTMTQVLEKSINTGAIFMQQSLGAEKFLDAVKRFGFGSQTEVELPAESPGNIRNLEGGGKVHYATASFGQGITVTPLQLALSYAAIANSGKMMKPRLVESIRYADGKVENFAPQEARQVVSPRAANTAAAMLVSVVENGHGKRAGVPGYYVAGKTGTAQVAKAGGGGYDPNITIGTFAGFAPIDDPVFAMVVKINNPKAARFAETTAAPAFGEIARYLLNYYQVPPTR